jgi:hypothetical protein
VRCGRLHLRAGPIGRNSALSEAAAKKLSWLSISSRPVRRISTLNTPLKTNPYRTPFAARSTNRDDIIERKKAMPDSAASKGGPTASQRITAQIAELNDWRGKMLADLRTLILAVDPDIPEEWKWKTGVWTRNGLVCAGGAFKDHVKLSARAKK